MMKIICSLGFNRFRFVPETIDLFKSKLSLPKIVELNMCDSYGQDR